MSVTTMIHPERKDTPTVEAAFYSPELNHPGQCYLTIDTGAGEGVTIHSQTVDTLLRLAERIKHAARKLEGVAYDEEANDHTDPALALEAKTEALP